MSDVEMFSLVTYDDEVEAGYLYLTEEFARGEEGPSYTEELHPNIFLDFNQGDKLIGVEFLAPTAHKIQPFSGKSVFVKQHTARGDGYFYSFRVSKEVINGTLWVKGLPIVFLFEDEECSRFMGFEIFPEDFKKGE